MSHFSTIKTKIKNKPQLIEALELLQYEVQENQELINPLDHQHEKVTQQYARMTVHNQVKEMGFKIEEEWEMDDNSIELTVTRWV